MDAELMALASSGAVTLVTLMVTDAWADTKAKVAALFDRRSDGEAIFGELEAARALLIAARERAGTQAEADVLANLRTRLHETLQADPHATQLLVRQPPIAS
jgi:hypothetical protein